MFLHALFDNVSSVFGFGSVLHISSLTVISCKTISCHSCHAQIESENNVGIEINPDFFQNPLILKFLSGDWIG